MCCMLTVLVFFGPRLAILVWWLLTPVYVNSLFGENWLLILLAWAFIPWTVLMFMAVGGSPLVGFDWVLLGLGVLADIASYSGGFWGNKKQIPGYTE
jgi:hypothetical protein